MATGRLWYMRAAPCRAGLETCQAVPCSASPGLAKSWVRLLVCPPPHPRVPPSPTSKDLKLAKTSLNAESQPVRFTNGSGSQTVPVHRRFRFTDGSGSQTVPDPVCEPWPRFWTVRFTNGSGLPVPVRFLGFLDTLFVESCCSKTYDNKTHIFLCSFVGALIC